MLIASVCSCAAGAHGLHSTNPETADNGTPVTSFNNWHKLNVFSHDCVLFGLSRANKNKTIQIKLSETPATAVSAVSAASAASAPIQTGYQSEAYKLPGLRTKQKIGSDLNKNAPG